MKCKLCSHEAPHPRAISDHWKKDHPAEFKKRQKAKKARAEAAEAPPLDETGDPETETMLALVATLDARDEAEEPIFDLDARARMLRYVAHRCGLIFGAALETGIAS